MTVYSCENILQNIYGSTATQETMSMLGGSMASASYEPRRFNVYYVDEGMGDKHKTPDFTMEGGKRKRDRRPKGKKVKGGANKNVIVYNGIEYVPNEDITAFLKEFYLYWRVSRSPTSAIYIIPSSSTLKQMIKQAKDIVGSANSGSIEARRAINEAKDQIGFSRYIFTMYGNNTNDDEYKIATSDDVENNYPNASFKEVRRTNLNMEVYYISHVSETEAMISSSKGGKGNKLKFIARCGGGVYIFQGDLPDPVERYNASFANFARKKGKRKTMKGGGRKDINCFAELVNNYYSLEDAAMNFANGLKSIDNADPVYMMFKQAFDDPNKACKVLDDEDEDDKNNEQIEGGDNDFESTLTQIQSLIEIPESTHARISQNMNNISKRFYSKKSNNNALKDISALYGDKNMAKIKADVATALYRNGYQDCSDIINIVSYLDNPESASRNVQSAILNAYTKFPLTSIIGRENIPLMASKKGKKKVVNKRKANEDIEEVEVDIFEDDKNKEESDAPFDISEFF